MNNILWPFSSVYNLTNALQILSCYLKHTFKWGGKQIYHVYFFPLSGIALERKRSRGTVFGPSDTTKKPSRKPAGGFQDGFHWGVHEVSSFDSENTRHVVQTKTQLPVFHYNSWWQCWAEYKDEDFYLFYFFLLCFTDSLRRTRLILLVLLLIGIYGLSRTPFLSGKGPFSDAGLFQSSFFLKLSNYIIILHAHCLLIYTFQGCRSIRKGVFHWIFTKFSA